MINKNKLTLEEKRIRRERSYANWLSMRCEYEMNHNMHYFDGDFSEKKREAAIRAFEKSQHRFGRKITACIPEETIKKAIVNKHISDLSRFWLSSCFFYLKASFPSERSLIIFMHYERHTADELGKKIGLEKPLFCNNKVYKYDVYLRLKMEGYNDAASLFKNGYTKERWERISKKHGIQYGT